MLIGHTGEPPAPHDVWTAWNLDPLIIGSLTAVVALYLAGSRLPAARPSPARAAAFAGGILALAIALVSPLDAASESLASAHMVQHVLLMSVAAPLLAVSAPLGALLRGGPVLLRTASRRGRRALGLSASRLQALRLPAVAWGAAALTLWAWHSRALYDLAVRNDVVHAVEHASFLAAGLAVWSLVVHAGGAGRVSRGFALLVLFTLGLQGTVLSALMTFSTVAWYGSYTTSSPAWGLTPLADQQLAGVLMWFPTGLLYAAVALWLLVRWLAEDEDDAAAVAGRHRAPKRSATSAATSSVSASPSSSSIGRAT